MVNLPDWPCVQYHEENQLSAIEANLDRQPQQPAHARAKTRCSVTAPDGRHLDDHCNGDLEWERRMKLLNPSWHPTESALWDVYHE